MDAIEQEMAIERAGQTIIARLHALVRKGYVAELGSGESAIWLRHPSSVFENSSIILHPSGKVTSSSSGQVHIHRDDEPEFAAFIASVPAPSLWDRSRAMRTRIAVWSFFAALVGASWILSRLILE